MRFVRSSALPTGLGFLAMVFLAAPCSTAADFPEAAQLPARAGLPDPLVMLDRRPVPSPEEWVTRRRPELKALFRHYMYGQVPAPRSDQTFAIEREDKN